jgi:hypothetical protein
MSTDPSLIRKLIERGSIEIGLDELRGALAVAGDEDDSWEAKGGQLRTDQVFRSVAGLANRSGGLLILGASRSNGNWQLDGIAFPTEPGLWIDQAIRDNLQPVPPNRIRTFELEGGRAVGLVLVDRHPEHLVLMPEGKVMRREHGRTVAVSDGAELTALVQGRTAPPASADIELPPVELAEAVAASVRDGRPHVLRPAIAGLGARIVRAAEFEPAEILDANTDRLCVLCASLVAAAPESELTTFALEAHHRAFDAAARFAPIPTARPDLDLYRSLLRSVRALGALLVRLGLWASARKLAHYRASGNEDVYPGWITFVHVQEERARMRPPNAEVIRNPLRRAQQTTVDLPALRPDGADEHQILDSVLNFDAVGGLLELDECLQRGITPEVFTDFAAFGSDPHHWLSAALLSDPSVRSELLPNRSQGDVARLLLVLEDLARNHSAALGERWGGIADPVTMQQLSAVAS